MMFDFRLLNRSRDMLIDIRDNTEFDPGWNERGGLFIARQKVSSLIIPLQIPNVNGEIVVVHYFSTNQNNPISSNLISK